MTHHSGGSATPSRLNLVVTRLERTTCVDLRGRADLSNHEQLRSDLESLDLSEPHAVILRLSDLEFCDVRAFSEILEFARAARRAGTAVSMVDPDPWIEVLAAILDLEGDLGGRDHVEPPSRLPESTRRFDPARDLALNDDSLLTLIATLIHGELGSPATSATATAWTKASAGPPAEE